MRILFLVKVLLVAVLFMALQNVSQADQYVSGNQVVHTRLAPVVVHRVLPPYKGMHVYAGRNTRR